MKKTNTFSDKELTQKAERYCSYQDRCRSEVKRKLLTWGARVEQIEQIISYLKQEKYIDEERFARSFVRARYLYKKWGRRKIYAYLKNKEVEDSIVNEALKEIDEEQYKANLVHILTKKNEELSSTLTTFDRKQKLYAFAQSRGYESYLFSVISSDLLGS